VLLVRKDVKWRNPTLPVPTSAKSGDSNGALFAKDWTAFFDVGGATIYAWRGWTATEVRVGHEWVRVFETHLEDWLDLPPELQLPDWVFQAGQAAELVSILDGSLAMAPLPTVLLGDFNVYVTPDVKPPVYQFLVGGPFPLDPALDSISPLRDAWAALRPHDPGFTWGFDELLRTGALSTRLDLVLATEDLHPLFTYRVGLHDRTRGGLHPSDHAGIVTTFSVR
jgi:endonuclease/exonuclease/phosphatase family metal-dependent hydrolase